MRTNKEIKRGNYYKDSINRRFVSKIEKFFSLLISIAKDIIIRSDMEGCCCYVTVTHKNRNDSQSAWAVFFQ